MQPQSGKKKKPQASSIENAVSTRVPVTVKGQRYAPAAGRHSQQTHRLAEERATAAGHASEKEQHAYDRTATTAKIAEAAAVKKLNQEQVKTK